MSKLYFMLSRLKGKSFTLILQRLFPNIAEGYNSSIIAGMAVTFHRQHLWNEYFLCYRQAGDRNKRMDIRAFLIRLPLLMLEITA